MKRAFAALALLGCALPVAAEEAVVNGFRMHYEDRGRGPAVVLLHGFTLDSRMEHPEKFNRDLEAFMKLTAGR